MRSCLRLAILLGSSLATQAALSQYSYYLNFTSLETNFARGSNYDIILNYDVDKSTSGFTYNFGLKTSGCTGEISSSVDYSFTEVLATVQPSNTALKATQVKYNFNQGTISGSNIFNKDTNQLEFCAYYELLRGDRVMKKDERNVKISYDFKSNFTAIN